jgi:MATE family multidrug resistance protein
MTVPAQSADIAVQKIPTLRQETRTIFSISLPLVAAYLAEMGMMITDMIIVGRLGSNELAAVGLTADWFYVLLLIGMGVVSIVGVLAAQSFGAGNRKGVVDAVEQGMIAATLLSVPVMLCIWYLGPALSLANQDPVVLQLITDYSRALTWSVVPALWFVVYRNFVTAQARASAIMSITLAALVLNVALNYTLVFGKFGFPALGVVGAGYGTSIVNWLMFAALAVHVLTSRQYASYRPRILPVAVDRALLREIFGLGFPISLTQILNGAMFTVAAVLVGTLGADILAAQLIVYTVIYVALSASIALGDAVRVRVAYGIGLASVDAAKRSAMISFSMAAVITVVATIVLLLFPREIVGIFLDTDDIANAEVLAIGIGLSVYAALFQLGDGVLIVIANALRGLRDTRSPLWISTTGYWVIGLASGTWLCFSLGHGVDGMWWGLIAGPYVAMILMTAKFRARLAYARRSLESETLEKGAGYIFSE